MLRPFMQSLSCNRSILRRAFSFASSPTWVPETLPSDALVDEENAPGYQFEAFYPANPGDVLHGKYELITKLGWGTSSTVWLARNISCISWTKPKKYFAIKICTRIIEQEEIAHELDITMHLSSVKSQHRGRGILGTAIESFALDAPTGSSHLALVFEPLREPLWLFRRRIMGQDRATRPMMPLVKAYIQILLEGLDFLHSEGHVIHTDLKLDNIMLTFENPSTIHEFAERQTQHPMARKAIGDKTIYRCHNNFGDINGNKAGLKKMIPKITDFGLAQRGDTTVPRIHPIQPNECQAPEVLLGVGWSYSADIWNFGVMIWELLAGHRLFQQDNSRPYSPVTHLADMVALLGPVPTELIQRERKMRIWQWSPKVQNSHGKLCSNAIEFYGGPFFTNEGQFVRNDLIPYARNLRKEMPECIPDEEADRFLKFMRMMLCWNPNERATAKELKNDAWLNDS